MPRNCRNSKLVRKIAQLQLRLSPLVPLPSGPPHPEFPTTLLAYHLLTEEQLDSIAHYYHQSTPGFWTHQYPACMNWDKAFLNASKRRSLNSNSRRRSQPAQLVDEWTDLRNSMTAPTRRPSEPNLNAVPEIGARRWSTSQLTNKERVAIKRRKVGKFIGLVDMTTPIAEVEGHIRHCMERAIRLAQEESRRQQEYELRGRKV